MLYWICPECGHECSPAVRECPTCTAAENAPARPQNPPPASKPEGQTGPELLTLAQNFESPSPSGPSSALLSPASYRNLVSGTNGHPAPSTAVLDDEPTVEIPLSWLEQLRAREAEAERGPEAKRGMDSLVKPLVDSAKEVEPEAPSKLASLDNLTVEPSAAPIPGMAQPAVSPVPAPSKAPAVVTAKVPPAELALQQADLAHARPAFEASPGWLPKADEREVEPVPSRRRSVAFLRAALHCGEKSELVVADLARWNEVGFAPAAGADHAESKLDPAPLVARPGSLALTASKINLAGESLSEILRALEKSAEDLEKSAIRAIQDTFEERPTALLLAEPAEIVAAPAPPVERWLRTPKLVFTPQPPAEDNASVLSVGPQAPTLAGPCLPPQLRNLSRNKLNQPPARKRSAAPTWMVSVLVATGLFLGAGSLIQYLSANRDAKAASVQAASVPATSPVLAPAAAPAPPAPAPVAQEHPGARFVEVAGLRVVTAPNKRQQLQYVVINHSTGQLAGLDIHITVHSPDSPSGPPLFSVSTIVPSLAPNQSKEIHTDLDASLTAASMPDWQSLKPEILITRP